MAKDAPPAADAPAKRRVGDHSPNVESGETLDKIANTEVEIAACEFYARKGKNGPYILSILILADGKRYHTGSPVVAERLAAIYDLSMDDLQQLVNTDRQPPAPSDRFPIFGTPKRVTSTNDATRSYWTID